MSLTTNSFKTRVGEVVIEIDDPFAVATADVSSFGKLKYEFYIDDGQEETTSITSGYGSLSFSVFDDNGAIFDRYNATAFSSVFVATMTFTPYGGSAQVFPFTFKRASIKFNQISRITTITLFPAQIQTTDTIADLFTGPAYTVYFYDATWDVILAGNVIDYCLLLMNASGSNLIRSANIGSPEGTVFRTTLPSVPGTCLLIWDNGTGSAPVPNSRNLSDLFRNFAALEGSYFGSAFGTNFWIYRLDATSPVTVTSDDIDNDLTIEEKADSSSITVTGTASAPSNLSTTFTDSDKVVNPSKVISITQNLRNGVIKGAYDGGGLFVASGVIDIEGRLVEKGVDAFKRLTSNEKPTNVKFTCNNFSLIKPYDCFQFNTSVPARYQSKIFRGNVFEYDFIKGICYIEAYQVD
jgi:hypothetical protein